MAPTELTLRPAVEADLDAIAELHNASRDAAYPSIPRSVHTNDEAYGWVRSWDRSIFSVWVATAPDDTLLGYARFDDGWLDDLYTRPSAQGTGVGSALIDLVKAQRPTGFCLWVFESNAPARRFYTARGLIELERTDGSANEEKAPDIRMAWPGADPLVFYRSLIDAVDADLGELLNRRAAITAAIQPHKDTSERDPDREGEIARTMAARAPRLGEERLRRILHQIISESLDAADSD